MLGWVLAALWAVALGSALFFFASRNYKRQLKVVATRRPNPTEAEFLAMMAQNVSVAAADFLWEETSSYLTPHATPHPDDDLIRELPIDDEDITIDWSREWAEKQGLQESKQPEWPEDWPVTIRNFGRWLDKWSE